MKKQRRYRIRYRRDGRDARIARHLAGTTDTLMLSYAAMQKQKATIDALVKERDSLRIANRNGLSLLEAAQKSAGLFGGKKSEDKAEAEKAGEPEKAEKAEKSDFDPEIK